MKLLFESHVDVTLEFKKHNCEEVVPIVELNAIQSLCKLLEVFATPQNGVELGDDYEIFIFICKMWFFFWYADRDRCISCMSVRIPGEF